MGILDYRGKREACTGPHVFHPHDHSWLPAVTDAEYRGKRKCSGRFWCVRCRSWFDGEACKPAARVVAA